MPTRDIEIGTSDTAMPADRALPAQEVLSMLFQHMLNGVSFCRMIFDGDTPVDWIYLYTNPAFHLQTKLGPVVGRRASEVFPGLLEADPHTLASFGRVARTQKPERIEIFFDSLGEWFEATVFSPQPGYYMNVFDVITERKKNDASLKQALVEAHRYQHQVEGLSKLYATLSSVNSAIVHCQSEARLFEEVCRSAVERGGFSVAWLCRPDASRQRLEVVAIHGALKDEVKQAVATMSLTDAPEVDAFFIARTFERGRDHVSNDPQHDPEVAQRWQDWCQRVGANSFAAIPVRLRGQVVAVLSLVGAESGFFSPEILVLTDEISEDMSFALDNFERERQRVAAEEKLARNEERLRLTLDVAGIGVKEFTPSTGCISLDATAAKITGFGDEAVEIDREVYLDRTFSVASPQAMKERERELERRNDFRYSSERSFVLPDGSVRWMRTLGGRVSCHSGRDDEPSVVSVMIDVTAQHEQAERERLAMAMFTNSREAIAITDAHARFIMVNKSFVDLMGYGLDEVLGSSPRLLKSGLHDDTFYRDLREGLQRDRNWRGEIWNRRKSGEIVPTLVNISAVHDDQGSLTHYVGQWTDISQQKQFEERITYLAYRDSLTDLPNRALLRDRVEQAVATAQREASTLALLFLDLDHFKNINDSLGHATGDRLLCEVARRLSAAVREMDTVGRLGGDEFLIMLPDTSAESAAHVAQKLVETVSRGFNAEGHDLTTTTSIGIAMYPRDGSTFDDLLKTADTAMYQAKNGGRNTYCFFTPEMNQAVFQRMMLESSLRRAIEAKEFLLFYQPQYDLQTHALIGAEALLRWPDPVVGLVSPGQFIPVAEESGLIEAIGAWVVDETCRQIRMWLDQGLPLLRVAVNVSAREFVARDMVQTIFSTLAHHGLTGDALEVEITEGVLANDVPHTLEVLSALQSHGIRVAVDDFGTGYSSLSYLKRFPINRLKIDQSFVREIDRDSEDRAIATAVVTLGHNLGMRVIAEGVEGERQLEILREMGCDDVQGYHLGRPMSAQDFTSLFLKTTGRSRATGERGN